MTRPLIIAHRGASREAPENTFAAFRRALELGADALEADVRLTADSVPVLFHDETLERTTNGTGPLRAIAWEQLRRLDAGSWFAASFAGERVPSLEEFLVWAQDQPSLRLVLDLKATAAIGAPSATGGLEEWVYLLLNRSPLLERTIIASFSPWSIGRVRTLLPNALTGLIYERRPTDPLGTAREARASALLPHLTALQADDVRRAHDAGLQVHVWGAQHREELEQLAQWDVDGLIVDDVALARHVIAQRA